MASPLDPLDVEALERSVNDSAVRVSTIWVSFLVFGLYLVVAAGGVTHRQLILEEPIKLPALNIDLPLVGFFFLAPLLFVILHAYVLVQVLLLARTAAAYNEALERNVLEPLDRARVRQRLANTLFAQLFAGSPREREGLLGAFLRLMAWITLAIAPVLVLLTFEVRFLPYHSSFVTWSLRILIVLDLAGVLLLWRGVLDAKREITWRGLADQPMALVTALLLVLFAGIVVTFPGERHTSWMRSGDNSLPECGYLFPFRTFADRLVLSREVLIDTEKLEKIEKAALKLTGQKPSEGERTRHFEERNLACGRFDGADLRRADMTSANLRGVNLSGAQLQGANLSGAQLESANLSSAQAQGVNLGPRQLNPLQFAQLQEADLSFAQLQGADLTAAQLQGANLWNAKFQGAKLGINIIFSAFLSAQLQGANLSSIDLRGADLGGTNFQGADLSHAHLQGADLTAAHLEGADLSYAQIQGVSLDDTKLTLTNFSSAQLWRANKMKCDDAQVSDPQFDKIAETGSEQGQRKAGVEGFIEEAVRDVPEPLKHVVQGKLRARLITDRNDGTTNEDIWRACATKALVEDEYTKKHVEYLIHLACKSEPDELYRKEGYQQKRYQKHLAQGIYRHWVSTTDDARAVALARGLLGLDGKPCPVAKDFDEETKSELREIAVKKTKD